jgi:hypothetical protein
VYKTISYCTGGDYKDYSRGVICLKGYEILSFYFYHFSRILGTKSKIQKGGNVKGVG